MTHLPQSHSEEVATKADLGALNDRIGVRFDQMEARFDRMEERLDRMQRFYVATTVGSMTALTAIFALVVRFLG